MLRTALFRSLAMLPLMVTVSCAPDWGSGDYRERDAGREVEKIDAGNMVRTNDAATEDPSSPAVAETVCKPGTVRCNDLGTTVQLCTAESGWQSKELCDAICTSGACAGTCKPGSKHCSAMQIPEKCSTMGAWVPLEACKFACTGDGECTGMCVPGEKRCSTKSSKTPQVCDEKGQWVDQDACKNVCLAGECAGSCAPSALRCGANNTPEECSAMGTWVPQDACPFVCTGEGKCGGECKPGERDCDGQAPRLCDQNGMWKASPACQGSTCSAGACVGQCEPQQARCGANETPEKCDANGAFKPQARCPYVCSGEGKCTGQCAPSSVMCSGATLRTCKADGSGYVDKECTMIASKNQKPVCVTDHCDSQCLAPMITCPGSALCWNLPMGCEQCNEDSVWRAAPKALDGDRICVPKTSVAAIRMRMIDQDTASRSYETILPGICANGAGLRNAYFGDLTCIPTSSTPDPSQTENAAHRSHTRVGTGMN